MLAAVTAALLTACAGGSATAGTAGHRTVTWRVTVASLSPVAPWSQSRPRSRTLTVADNGATVRMRIGQSVRVVLASGGMMWDAPKATGHAFHRTSVSGGYPTGRPAKATFRAVHAGRSSISSVTDAKCLHAKPPCTIAQRLWSVVVVVRR
jgi:hypothetical protein